MASPCRDTDLSGRTATCDLLAWSGIGDPAWQVALAPTHSRRADWRIIDLWTVDSRSPWQVEVTWGAGDAAGQTVVISVAQATRICVHASSLRVRARNFCRNAQKINVAIADGFDPTRNQLEFQDNLDAGFPVEIAIPAFADRLHLEIANRALAGTTEIRQHNANATEVGRCFVSDLYGGPGLPVGHLSHVEIVAAGVTTMRAIFTLRL